MLVYHRHLDCLFESANYVTVSHVWHPAVADLQYRRARSDASIKDVASVVREVPPRIFLGLAKVIPQPFEVWHDYISVPQWQDDVKTIIIQAIPKIFKQAYLTVAYLSDIESSTIKAMRDGPSMPVRVRGISDMCNAKWFSRTWTAMEFVQSHRLLAMLKDYVILDGSTERAGLFVEELDTAWSAEVRARGDSHKVEDMAEVGRNLVPWQLGPLARVRACNLRGERVTFAMAYELLACRCVTNRRDFFHALLGVVNTGLTEAELSADEHTAMLQVARSCIASGAGDYSPLFMIPERRRSSSGSGSDGGDDDQARRGYLDLKTFVLGHVVRAPAIAEIRLRGGNPVIRGENIGTVDFATREQDWGHTGRFFGACRLAVSFTGPDDVGAFVGAVGARLYGQSAPAILARLSLDHRRLPLVASALRALYDLRPEEFRPDITDPVADAMGVSSTALGTSDTSPLDFMEAHGKRMDHLEGDGGDGGGGVALVGVACGRCRGRFLLRPPSRVHGAAACRVPGLKYYFTHEGGAGLLVKDGQMVGRFIWGTPTCGCPKLEDVEVRLGSLPVPRPNTTEYGRRS